MTTRVEKLRSEFDNLGIDGCLVTFPPHLRYLSGFTGSCGLGLVTRTSQHLITDGRYVTQARRQVRGWRIFVTQDSLFEQLRKLLKKGLRLAFDGNTLSYTAFLALKNKFPHVRFVSKLNTIEGIASVKEASEIPHIRKAIAISDRVFAELLDFIRPGVAELDIAAEISYRQRKYGAEGDAFDSIVASGERGALPHGRASARKIRKGELVTLDFGCVTEGYSSDLTRTVSVGKPPAQWRKIYQIVLDAQLRAIDSAASGMLARDLDAVARSYIRKMGYGSSFPHSLGHGLGMQIHEPPRISSLSTARLRSGNVITIEPGIYIPNRGGIRIEDDILIRNGSCEVLTRAPKELVIL